MFTIRARIILATLAVFTAALLSVCLIVYGSYRDSLNETLHARLDGYAERLTAEIEEEVAERSFPSASDFTALHPEGLSHTEIRILDSLGTVVYSDSLIALLPRRNWVEVATGVPAYADAILEGTSYAMLAMSVEVSDRYSYSLQIISSRDDVEASLAGLRRLFLIAVPVALFLAGFASYFIVGRAFKPIAKMIDTARSIGAKNLDRRIEIPAGKDEVHRLAVTLNEMMERIAAAFASQKRFIADASHEIRTPLAIIRSELEYAAGHGDDPQARAGIETSLEEVDHLKRLSDDLLLLATLDASDDVLDIRPLRLDELLAECVKHLTAVAQQSGVTLELRVSEAIEINADEDRLRRAVLNLVDNAVKYSLKGGAVEVVLEKRGTDAVIVVRDHGIGIPYGEISQIFDRYHRVAGAERIRAGNGLGLAIVKRIAELHRGEIAVESTPGKGSTFSVVIPLHAISNA